MSLSAAWHARVHILLILLTTLALMASPVAARTRGSGREAGLPAPEMLSGTVQDESAAPIEGARVLLVELDRAVLTDARGAFRFPDVARGRYTLEVRRTGYRTELVPVDVPASGPVDVTLREAPIPLEPLNVTVARGPLSPNSSPLPVSVLGEDAMDRDVSVSLAKTLARLPGVRDLSTGQEIGKPVIRGLSGSRVLVLSDGLRLEDYAWSDEDGPAVDAEMADRIEVIRGPATVLYGADAVGGVVNVIPRPIPDAAGGPGFKRGEAQVHFASNNREGGGVLRAEGASGDWGWLAMATGRFAEALHTPVGELDNTGFLSFNAEAAAVKRGPWGTLTGRFVHNGGEFKLLEEDAPANEQAGVEEAGPERKANDERLQLLGNFPLGAIRLETRAQGQIHHMVEMEDDPAALAQGQRVEVPVFDLTLTTGLGEALLHHSLVRGTSGTIGVTGKLQHSATDGVIPLIPAADMMSGGVFLLERAEKGPVTLLAGVRGDLAQTDAVGHAARHFDAFTWSAGAAWRLTGSVSLTGNVGTAWRAPTLFELYASGPRLGEARYEIGDANLHKETSLNLDGGVRWQGDRVRGHVAVYRNRFDRFLFIQPTDEIRDGYRVFYYRQADARLQGGEGSLEVEAAPWLTLSASGDLVRGTNETVDEPLPLMPPRRIIGGAEVHGAWPSTEDWTFGGVEVENVAKPDRLNPFDIPVDGYTLVHVTAGWRGEWMGREAGVDLRVRNAANTSYKDFLSRYKAFALNPGRDVVLRVRMAF